MGVTHLQVTKSSIISVTIMSTNCLQTKEGQRQSELHIVGLEKLSVIGINIHTSVYNKRDEFGFPI